MWKILGLLSVLIATATCVEVRSSVTTFQTGVDRPVLADPDRYGWRYCASWKLADGTLLWSDCDAFKMDRCGKTLDFEYKCCTQFKQVDSTIFPANRNGSPKCARVVPQWDFCPNVLKNGLVGYKNFGQALNFGVFLQKQPYKTYTIFAPHVFNQQQLQTMYGKYVDRQQNNPILHHVANNRYYAEDLVDGMVLDTMYGTKLKVTKYSYGVTCIECVEIMEANYECENGVIHLLRKPLMSPRGMDFKFNNLMELLENNPASQMFAQDLPQDVKARLRDANSGLWYTVLVPSASAWTDIRNKYSGVALGKVATNHVIPKLYCSSAIIKSVAEIQTLDEGGETISANCETVQTGVNNAQFRESRYVMGACGQKRSFQADFIDFMASNGVAHGIDGALVPISVMSIKDAADCFPLVSKTGGRSTSQNSWRYLLKNCDLRIEAGKKYAVLIPEDYAMDWWKDYAQFQAEYQKFQTDEQYRCRVARYHIAAYNQQLERIASLWHEQTGYASNTQDADNSNRFEVDYFLKDRYRSDLYFHYSPVVGFKSYQFADGTIYRLRRINVIPELYMMQVMEKRKDLTKTYKRAVELDLGETEFKPRMPLNLYLAIVNRGWVASDGADRIEYSYPKDAYYNFTMLHHVPMYLWGGDIGYFKPNTVHRFMSSLGVELIFWMDGSGTMRIGHKYMTDRMQWPKVIEFNLHAIDGIIWLLDGVLICPPGYCEVVLKEYDYYNVFAVACKTRMYGERDVQPQFKRDVYKWANNNKDDCMWYSQPTIMVEKKKKIPLVA